MKRRMSNAEMEASSNSSTAQTSAQKRRISNDEMMKLESVSTDPSATESFLRGTAQGALFDFADEIAGGFGALTGVTKNDGLSFGQRYEKERDESRANFADAQRVNPSSYLAGQVAGGVGAGFGTAALLPGLGALSVGSKIANSIQATGKVGKIVQGAAQGAINSGITGAAQGVGASEGKSVKDVFKDGAGGAKTGAGIGSAFGGLGRLLPGVRGSISNDLWGKTILPVTVGDEGAEYAYKLLKDPELRNKVVGFSNRKTVAELKDKVFATLQNEARTFQKIAGEKGNKLLQEVEPQVEKVRAKLADDFRPLIEKIRERNIKTEVPEILEEVEDILRGRGLKLRDAADLGTATPAADSVREAREALKRALFKNGNPGEGIKDRLKPSEEAVLQSAYRKMQNAYKDVPQAAKADELYTKASNYVGFAEQKLFRPSGSGKRELSNASVESLIMGKGSAGRVEDLDRVWKLRKDFVRSLAKEGVQLPGAPTSALKKAREVASFNRLGSGESTGKALAPLVAAMQNPGLSPLVLLSYQPRTYLRALAAADKLNKEDKAVLGTILKNIARERDKAAVNMYQDDGQGQ